MYYIINLNNVYQYLCIFMYVYIIGYIPLSKKSVKSRIYAEL